MLLAAMLLTVMVSAQVTPPIGAKIEEYQLSGNYAEGEDSEELQEAIQVATVGNDVYFCLPTPIPGATQAWVKGTLSGDEVTFPVQLLAVYSGEKIYFAGWKEGDVLTDVVFTYSSEYDYYAQGSAYILLNSGNEKAQSYGHYDHLLITRTAITPEGPDEPTVTPPSGLTTEEYLLTGSSILYNNDGAVEGMESVSWKVRIGFYGSSEVYIQGIFGDLPEAWVKGTLSDGVLTLANGQYLGKMPLKAYFCGSFLNEITDAKLDYDRATGTFFADGYYLVLNSQKDQLSPYGVYAGVTISKIAAVAAVPATPSIAAYQSFDASEGYGILSLDIPTTGTDDTPLKSDNMSYRLLTEKNGVQQIYVFTKQLYVNLPQDEMTLVPLNYDDDYDFDGGHSLYFYEDFAQSCDRIGLQSVYTVNGEETCSQIGWYMLGEHVGVASTAAAPVATPSYTDLQGRRVSAAAKGLVIKTVQTADGQRRSVKVLR